ncbi:MAG: 30S ribosomal protein S6 [Anaerolineae bacterium]
MRTYDIGFIVEADLGAEEIAAQVDFVKDVIDRNGGQIRFVDQCGRRRLAYPVNDERDGFYVFIIADLPADSIMEIERNMRLTEPIMRFLVTRTDE